MAAVLGDLFLDEMTEASMRDERILALAQKVDCEHDASLDHPDFLLTPVHVDVTLRSGATHGIRVERVPGHPDQPLSADELADKFRRCARFGRPALEAARVDQALALLARLPAVADVRELTRMLQPAVAAYG
jgi:2-methylcitrate dehydratase PrpD